MSRARTALSPESRRWRALTIRPVQPRRKGAPPPWSVMSFRASENHAPRVPERGAAVKDGRRPPPQAARSVLDGRDERGGHLYAAHRGGTRPHARSTTHPSAAAVSGGVVTRWNSVHAQARPCGRRVPHWPASAPGPPSISSSPLPACAWNSRQVPQLGEDGHVVPRYPELREPAMLYAQDSPEVKPHLLPGRRKRPHLSHLGPLVRGPPGRQVPLCEDVRERLSVIRKHCH